MTELTKPNGYWTKERVLEEARKFKNYSDFHKKSRGADGAAQRLGILNKACSHMIFQVNLREKKFIDSLCRKIKKIDLNIKIEKEVKIAKDSRIDLIIHLPEFELSIPVEVKHGDSTGWTESHVKEQKSRYDKILRNRKGFTRTYVVSPKGKWGHSEKEFLDIIKHLIKHEELYNPVPLNQLAA